jgi:hypothetical protein
MSSVIRGITTLLCIFLAGALTASEQSEIRCDPAFTAKAGFFAWDLPSDPSLYSDSGGSDALLRLRLAVDAHYSDWIISSFAYEHRLWWWSASAADGSAGILPSSIEAPYRVTPLDWQLDEQSDFRYSHEIDRAAVACHFENGHISIGRQAIGLGRGVLFSAVDLFAPFATLEVDREWRRGVDAVRGEWMLTEQTAMEVIGAFGERWDESALLARVRGYLGEVDAELMFGRRAEDDFGGIVVSSTIGDAEGHAEVAVFDTPEAQDGHSILDDAHLPVKAVIGGSYTFAVGSGLTLIGEWHYSEFGVDDIGQLDLASDTVFTARLIRGDMHIMGRQALALQGSYAIAMNLAASANVLFSPQDGSGALTPLLRWDVSDNITLLANIVLPWGDTSRDGQLRSEYGNTATSAFVQLAIYY